MKGPRAVKACSCAYVTRCRVMRERFLGSLMMTEFSSAPLNLRKHIDARQRHALRTASTIISDGDCTTPRCMRPCDRYGTGRFCRHTRMASVGLRKRPSNCDANDAERRAPNVIQRNCLGWGTVANRWESRAQKGEARRNELHYATRPDKRDNLGATRGVVTNR